VQASADDPSARDVDDGTGLPRNVEVILAERPEADWRRIDGFGWIVKAWLHDRGEARDARALVEASGWSASRWGRKVRVRVRDGFDGERVVLLIADRWPRSRIQLQND
jgi:hypothetical protein